MLHQAHEQQGRGGQLAVKVEPERLPKDGAPARLGGLEEEPQLRRGRARTGHRDPGERRGQEVDIFGRSEATRGALDRRGAELGASGNPHGAAERSNRRRELDDRARRHRPQIVGQHELGQLMRQLGNGVFQALANSRRQEGEPLEEPLDIGVGALLGQQRGDRRLSHAEGPPHFPEVRELALIKLTEHAGILQPMMVYFDQTCARPPGTNSVRN